MPLQIVNLNAAGIDVGSRSQFVAIDQVKENVREFGVYTKDQEETIRYLRTCKTSTVAGERTGTYWQTLFNALQKAQKHGTKRSLKSYSTPPAEVVRMT